jgi:hypothetical protein
MLYFCFFYFMEYLVELRLLIEAKFKQKITKKSDAEFLRISIFNDVKEFISESTLRRFFLLMKSNNSYSIATLNILSKYVGFKNFEDFETFQNRKIVSIVSSNDIDISFIIKEIEKKNDISIFEINLLVTYLKTQFDSNSINEIQSFFNNDKIAKLILSNYNTHNFFSQQIGKLLFIENSINMTKDITNTKFFSQLILSRYVDIQNNIIEKYYRAALESTTNHIEKTFMNSVLCLNALYYDDINAAINFYNKIDPKLINVSSELAGRIALLRYIITHNEEDLFNNSKKYKNEIHFFSIDIVQWLIYKNNLELLKKWYESYDLFQKPFNNWISTDLELTYRIGYLIAKNKQEELNDFLNSCVITFHTKTTIIKIINNLKLLYNKPNI